MKKHPVDDLFKSKLSNLERKPSAAAWLRIQDGRQKNTRTLAWVWYVAAGVALAFLTGYAVWVNQATYFEPGIAEVQKVDKIVVPQLNRDSIADENAAERIASIEKESIEVLAPESAHIGMGISKIVTKRQESGDLGEKNQDGEIAKVERPMEAGVEQIVPEQNMTQQKVQIQIAEEKPKENAPEKIENRTILVKVEVPDEESADKPKASRFTKIFRQLKNVKDGESVNWTDVGFNPKAVVARVDNRLRLGEEKVSEKYQDIKERTKL